MSNENVNYRTYGLIHDKKTHTIEFQTNDEELEKIVLDYISRIVDSENYRRQIHNTTFTGKRI